MGKSVSAKASMSALVRKLLDEGHKFIRLADGRFKIGDHYFSRRKRK